jgi:hypothetical protein
MGRSGNAKVYEIDGSLRRAADIRRLDIAVDDGWILLVQIVKCIKHRSEESQCLLPGEARGFLTMQILAQVFARHKIHHQVDPLTLTEVVVHERQCGMAQMRE